MTVNPNAEVSIQDPYWYESLPNWITKGVGPEILPGLTGNTQAPVLYYIIAGVLVLLVFGRGK